MISYDEMSRIDEGIDNWLSGVSELDDNDMRDRINYDYLYEVRQEIDSYLDDDCETDSDKWLYCALKIWDDYVVDDLDDEDAIDSIYSYIRKAQQYIINAGTDAEYSEDEAGIVFDDDAEDEDF